MRIEEPDCSEESQDEKSLALDTGQVPTVWLQAVVLGYRFPRPRLLA